MSKEKKSKLHGEYTVDELEALAIEQNTRLAHLLFRDSLRRLDLDLDNVRPVIITKGDDGRDVVIDIHWLDYLGYGLEDDPVPIIRVLSALEHSASYYAEYAYILRALATKYKALGNKNED